MDPTAPPQASEPPPRRYPWGHRPRLEPDPGRPLLAWVALLAAVLFIGITAWIQQTAPSAATRAAGQPPLVPTTAPVPGAQFSFFAKSGVKLYYLVDNPGTPSADQHAVAESIVQNIESIAGDAYDQLRTAMIAGDLLGAEKGLDRLEKIKPEALEADPRLAADCETLRALYTSGTPPADPDAFIDRHGWFGRLALTGDLPKTDAARDAIVGGGGGLAFLMVGFLILAIAAIVTGFVLLVVGIVKASSNTLPSRFTPPAPGGSVAIETVAVFILGFIALKFITELVAQKAGPQTAMYTAMGLQWCLAPLILYPILRGVPAKQWLYLVGLHRGRGLFREIGAGIVGYLATLPLLAAGIALAWLAIILQGIAAKQRGEAPQGVQNPIFDMVGGSHGTLLVVLFAMLASLWAPLVEEAVFRGCLYRHLRGYLHFVPAGIVTALGFGFMHNYPVLLLGPVIALGFGFALIREWRGSLVACMTAHCIHNATIVTVLLSMLKLADV